jgi:hypothetical protein
LFASKLRLAKIPVYRTLTGVDKVFKEILDLLPPDPTGVVITVVVAIGIGVGTITALLGALHSKVALALVMLAIGAILGYKVPIWEQWNVNIPTVIAIGAVVFGLLGYGLHRWCVAIMLGLLVTGVSTFILYDQTQPLEVPGTVTVQLDSSVADNARATWTTAAPKFRSLAPWLALGSFVLAGILGFALPRFGMATLHSLGGTLVTLASIRLGQASPDIKWLDSFRSGPMTTAAFCFSLLLVGFLTQIALLYRKTESSQRTEESMEPASRT